MLRKLLAKFKNKDPEPLYLNVWTILYGPFHKDELPHQNVPDELNYMIVCKVDDQGEVYDQEMWFTDLDSVRVWEKHFATTIDPIRIPIR